MVLPPCTKPQHHTPTAQIIKRKRLTCKHYRVAEGDWGDQWAKMDLLRMTGKV
jgi:hypothetical protein